MAFQPGLMNRALSNREIFRQVQTMPVTAYDPRPRRSEELMDYVSEGTEGQWAESNRRKANSAQVIGVLSDADVQKAEQRNPGSTTKSKRPRVSMGTGSSSQAKAARTRRSAKSLAPKSPGEQTETGREIKGALSGIGQGLAALFSEKPAAPQQERPVLPMKSRDNYVEEGTHGQNWDLIRLGMDAQEQERKKQERSKGSRGHFDEGHR